MSLLLVSAIAALSAPIVTVWVALMTMFPALPGEQKATSKSS